MGALENYLSKFSKLRVDRSKGPPAPHKPILLLSIIAEIEEGKIRENKIYITPELVARFKDIWHKLVTSTAFSPNFALPFFHLRGDKFWTLKTIIGREILLSKSHSIKSFGQLKESIDYAYFDNNLYQLLVQPESRLALKSALIKSYFGDILLSPVNEFIAEIVQQIITDPPEKYKLRAENFEEEDVFVRGGVFKREIPKIYNYTCCVSGMRIITSENVQMIDACHIVPFSESHDDTISNGISLCPNLHRAFDRGLITINENYTVSVNPFFEDASNYSIRQFDGKRILLPSNKDYYPSITNLLLHRNRFN